MFIDPSGLYYGEYYLYAQKQWEMAPSGANSYTLASGVMQNAPIVVTASGYIESNQSDPWARIDGLGKYDKVGYKYFTLHTDGTVDSSKKEFALVPDSSGKLVFNKSLEENVFIEYETWPSGNYIVRGVDFNPVRNQVKSGFIHFSGLTSPSTISISPQTSYVYANGYNFVRLTAQVLDANFDPSPNQSIYFSIPDGILGKLYSDDGTVGETDASGTTIRVNTTTGNTGSARVVYIPNNQQSGTQVVSCYLTSDTSIFNRSYVVQQYTVYSEFTLDFSLLDGLDYLA